MKNLMGLNMEKINAAVLKQFMKADKNKDKLMIDELITENGFNRILLSFAGHNLFNITSCFFPFDLNEITASYQSNKIENTNLKSILSSAQDVGDFSQVRFLYEKKTDSITVCVFGNDNFKVGVNKDYLKFINIDNCIFYGAGTKAPLKVYCREEFVAMILQINPSSGCWD